jgi:hypothetical protein
LEFVFGKKIPKAGFPEILSGNIIEQVNFAETKHIWKTHGLLSILNGSISKLAISAQYI